MQADGQPQVAAAQVRVSEDDSETGRIGDAEPRGVGIHAVQQPKDRAHREDGGPRSQAGQQELKSITAEEYLFAGGSQAKEDRGEGHAAGRSPIRMRDVRSARRQRRHQNQAG